MGKMPTTLQVLQAIHDGLPKEEHIEDVAKGIPDKRQSGRDFAQKLAGISKMEQHPSFPVSDEDIDHLRQITQNATSIRSLISDARMCIVAPFYAMSVDFLSAHESVAGATLESRRAYDAFKEMHWRRYDDKRPHATKGIRNDYPGFADEIMHIIALHGVVLGGIQNVAYNACATLFSVPKLYKETTGRLVRPRTWNHIAESSLPFLKQIATAETHVFEDGIGPAMKEKNARDEKLSPHEDLFDWPGFDTRALNLNERMEIELHPRIIRSTRKKLLSLIAEGKFKIGERIGCPGLAAFPVVHRRVMLAAKEGIFPYAEHVLSLPSE